MVAIGKASGGMPAAAETIGVGRDIQMAELTGCRFHVAHLLPHMTHDFDLTGPNQVTVKRRAKAAG